MGFEKVVMEVCEKIHCLEKKFPDKMGILYLFT
jgi:hypothetical protein